MKYYDTFYDYTGLERTRHKNDTQYIAAAIKDIKDGRACDARMVPVSYIIGEYCVKDICGERTTALR